METKINYSLAGFFVICLIAAITMGIIWLSSGFDTSEYTFYKVYMQESVSGLSLDAPTEFNGVNVGTVYKMRINRSNPRLVELLIKIKKDTPVTVGTRAKLGMRALTGVAYLLLEDKGTDMRPLVKLGNQKYPVILTTPSILVRLDTTLTQLTDSFRQVSTSIRSLLDPENLKSIKLFLHAGKGTFQILETKTLPRTNEAISSINTLTENLSDVSSEIRQNPSILIRGKEPRPLGPGER